MKLAVRCINMIVRLRIAFSTSVVFNLSILNHLQSSLQGRVKRSRRGVSPGPRGIPRKSPGPKGIPRLVGNEYFPRDIRNPDTLPVRTAYEPDKPLVLYKPEGTKAMLLEGEVVVCHQAHAGPDVTRGRYLTHYDGEYRKRCLDCKAQLSQNKRDRVFVPVISKGSKLKAVYVRDEEMETEETAKSKGRQGKRGDRTTLPIESYRLLSRLVPMLQKLLPCKST